MPDAVSLPLADWLEKPELVSEEELQRSLEAYPWCGTLHLIRAKLHPENPDFVNNALLRLPNSLALERWVKLGGTVAKEDVPAGSSPTVLTAPADPVPEPLPESPEEESEIEPEVESAAEKDSMEGGLEPKPEPETEPAPEPAPEPEPESEPEPEPEPEPESEPKEDRLPKPDKASFEDWLSQMGGSAPETLSAPAKSRPSFVPQKDNPLEELYAGELAASGTYLDGETDAGSNTDGLNQEPVEQLSELKPRRRNKEEEGEFNTQLDNRAKRFSEFDPAQGTETLAHIYEQQGLCKQAIAIFEQLSLKFPQKSAYFAGRIKELEKKCLDS